MVVNESILKKLIKSAWSNNSLYWGMIESRYVIGSSWWFLRIDECRMSQKTLAALVEYTGIIPKEDQVFKCSEGNNQHVLKETVTEQYKAIDDLTNYLREPIIKRTDIIISDNYGFPTTRLYQNRTLKKTVAISEIITGLIEGKTEDGEDSFNINPYISKSFVYWMTDEADLIVYPILYSGIKEDGHASDTASLYRRLSEINLFDGTNV